MKRYRVGYTQGVFDLLHDGHLNLFERCKEHCDYLIVGVCNDEYVRRNKNYNPVFNEDARCRLVASLKSVDEASVIPIEEVKDKMVAYGRCHFDVLFSGDDWKGTERYNKTESDFKGIGVDIVYLPYTKGISTSELKERILKM